MNKEELIKVFSSYLPYKLKVKIGSEDFYDLVGVDLTDQGLHVINKWGFGKAMPENSKPVLYDLSYLTKEIEHGGKKFIPMHILKNGGTDLNEYRFLEWKGYSVIDNEQHETCYCPKTMSFYQFYMGDNRMCTDQYEKFQLLLKWHFNVFNLPETEFINKATLNK